MGEGSLGGRLDPVPGGEVVHAEPVVILRPKWNRAVAAVDEVGRRDPHVWPGDEDLAIRLERPFVPREHGRAIAVGEAETRLGARVGNPAGRELAGHRPGETSNLIDVDVGQHPRSARGDRKELVVDDHECLHGQTVVVKFDQAHGLQRKRFRS
jgi:hypothetical protein